MRLISCLFACLYLVACSGDATPEDACSNVETVCNGNADLSKVQTACETAVSDADQTTLNCIDAANTCSEASACTATTTN